MALCEPLRNRTGPARVLEVGAGTGAVTRHIAALIGDGDRLDICELHARFADVLESTVLRGPNMKRAVDDGRVRLLRCPIQDVDAPNSYDFAISGLPLTSFSARDVEAIFEVLRSCLKPGGVLSYFEYIGVRRIARTMSLGSRRRARKECSMVLNRQIKAHQFARRTVLRNIPPAHARHLKFE